MKPYSVISSSSHEPGSINEWAATHQLHWGNQKIAGWDESKFIQSQQFMTSHFWSDRHSVNVFSVIGTAHPDYIGLTWSEFLSQGKRMSINQHLLCKNPAYYLDTDVKNPSILYVSLDGKHWYVNGDGNHRTCLARFQFARLNADQTLSQTMLHGVHVDDYRINHRLQELYGHIDAVLKSGKVRHGGGIEAVRETVARDDGPAWKLDYYLPRIRHTTVGGNVEMLDQDGARALLGDLVRRSRSLLSRMIP